MLGIMLKNPMIGRGTISCSHSGRLPLSRPGIAISEAVWNVTAHDYRLILLDCRIPQELAGIRHQPPIEVAVILHIVAQRRRANGREGDIAVHDPKPHVEVL